MTVPRSSPPTLGGRIHAEIEGKILSGAWPPGHRLPYEHELMAQYGCARMTVNRAVAALAEAGLVERRRRAGTFVARPRAQSAVLAIPDLPAEIAARGELYGYELLDSRRRRASAADRDRSGIEAGTAILDLACRHLADGRPFAHEDRLVSLGAVPDAAQAPFETVPPGSWLLEHVPWTEAEHRISAIAAEPALAAALRVPPGTACLRVERRTWRAGAVVTAVRQSFVGDAYGLVARFGPR